MRRSNIGYVSVVLACGLCFLVLGGQSRDCIDADGDGFFVSTCGSDCGPIDCDDTNPAVNPGTTEGPGGDPVCSDGLDNDCDGHIDDLDGSCLEGEMVLIPAGCFDMGDPFSEGEPDELPLHSVCISAFEMDVHEVTNAEYAACVASGRCNPPAHSSSATRAVYYGNPAYDDYPVIYMGWQDAADFCAWAGKQLPTEAEWEYADRGGLAGKRYSRGDAIGGSDANCWNSGDAEDNDTNRVKSYPANGYGLFDMEGNAWEWVRDWWNFSYYAHHTPYDPQGPLSGMYRVLRGGSWGQSADDLRYLRVASRDRLGPMIRLSMVGFRCAR